MLILVAPLVAQLSVLLVPAVMLVGFAVKEVIDGGVVSTVLEALVTPAQLARLNPIKSRAIRRKGQLLLNSVEFERPQQNLNLLAALLRSKRKLSFSIMWVKVYE
jgi:hypothetical protein